VPSPVISEVPILNKDASYTGALGKPKQKNNNAVVLLSVLLVLLVVAGAVRLFGAAQKTDHSKVVVMGAAKDLPPGFKIGYQDLHAVSLPAEFITDDMEADISKLVGRTTRSFIRMAEPVHSGDLLPQRKDLSEILGNNERALSLKLNSESLVDHSIQPGDRVDVIATTAGPQGKKYTKTICQNVLVLMSVPKEMLGTDVARNEEQDKITLALTPEYAEQVSHAADVSKIRIVLRNKGYRTVRELPGADERDLLPHNALRVEPPVLTVPPPGVELPPPPMPPVPAIDAPTLPAPVQWVVDVFLGAKKEANAVGSK
jgi:Flp pilus assembly protein CpaB